VAASIAILAALVSTGCASQVAATESSSVEKPNLTIATVPTASSAGLYIAQRDTSITVQTAAIMALGDFPTQVEAVRLQRVPDLMQSFGLLKKRFDITAMTNPVGT